MRRELWRKLRADDDKAAALSLQRTRFALRKRPETLTARQSEKLASIQKTNKPLYRA